MICNEVSYGQCTGPSVVLGGDVQSVEKQRKQREAAKIANICTRGTVDAELHILNTVPLRKHRNRVKAAAQDGRRCAEGDAANGVWQADKGWTKGTHGRSCSGGCYHRDVIVCW